MKFKNLADTTRAVKRVLGAMLAQVVSSGSTFALTTYCLTAMSKVEFGEFSFAFSAIFVIGGLVVPITGPAFTYYNAEFERGSPARAQLLLDSVIATVAMLPVVALPIAVFVAVSGTYLWVSAATLLAAIGFVAKDIYTRAAYAEQRESLLLHSNALAAIITFVGIAALSWQTRTLSAPLALLMYGIGQLASALMMQWRLHASKATISLQEAWKLIARAWKTGKFALVSSVTAHARTQLPTLLAASTIGAVGVAELNAARLYIQPFLIALSPMSNLTVAHFAQKKATPRAVKALSLLFIGGGVLYGGVLAVGAWIDLLPRPSGYEHFALLSALWCAHGCAVAVRQANYAISESRNSQHIIARWSVWALLATILLSYPLLLGVGIGGAVIALICAEVLLAATLFKQNIKAAEN